ncbi:ABC transporter ATP-binding protein [Agrococcus jejuensis]|uniref:ATP-binding cassette, subfamily C n=1 Tax=Agrococcus jejuensis TaxID=399736 RepID=A0A1G8AFQ7_9MICO|nr:ABC transporter ATP-binding protein [Agrococcus jejuensis]SDH19729.1 ATP-binding cassette, subfamily C [Agrococcus jejuensis]
MSASTLPIASGRDTARLAWGILRRRPWTLAGALVLLAGTATAGLAVPTGLGMLVDVVVDGGDPVLAIALIAVGVVGGSLLGAAGAIVLALVLETALARLREDVVDAALSLSPAVVDTIPDGELVARTTHDVEAVGEVTTEAIPAFAGSLLAVVATGIGLAALHPLLLVAMLAVVPVHAVALRHYIRRAPRMYAAERAAVSARSREMLAAMRSLPTLQAYGWTETAGERIGHRSWTVLRWALRTRLVQARLGFGMNMAEAAGLASILAVGGWLAGSGTVTVGEVTTASLLFLALFGPLAVLVMLVDDLQAASAALARIVGVVRSARTDRGRTADASIDAPAAIAVTGLRAGYPDREDALHAVDLHVPHGQWVAIVGSSGAGKTTLARAIVGLLEARAGSVSVAGHDPVTLDEASRAERVVMVGQDVHVFSGSVRDNLLVAAPSADDAALVAAMDAVAGAAWRTRIGDLDALVGDGNAHVEPVDAQRIALARVLLSSASIVVLDEATADADTHDARALELAARRAFAGRTVLTVAHRLSQARDADRILVLDAGRVVEDGAHDDLAHAGGPYATLWAAWSSQRG